MAQTTFQQWAHGLRVGVAATPFDLKTLNTSATSFILIGTSRAWNQTPLPPGIVMSSAGVFTGTPTAVGATAVKIRASRGIPNLASSWATRTSSSYNSVNFADATPITAGLNPGGTSYVSNTTFDSTFRRSGTGSAKQSIPAGSSVNTSSVWDFPTRIRQTYTGNPPAFASNTGFALGDEFWICYDFRPTRTVCQYPWGNYPKVAIMDMLPWTTNLNLGPTANVWEHVLIPGYGGPYGYVNGVDGNPWNQFRVDAEGDIIYQPNIRNTARALNGDNPGLASGGGTAWTSGQQQRARNSTLYNGYANINEPDGRPDPLTGGFQWAFDQWHTVMYHVRMDLPPAAFNSGQGRFLLSGQHLFEVEVAHEGQDFVKVFSETYALRCGTATGPNYFVRDTNQPNGTQATTFSGIRFTNLMFGIDISGAPSYDTWIADVFSSPTRPAAPDMAAGNYRTQDVIATFKVSP